MSSTSSPKRKRNTASTSTHEHSMPVDSVEFPNRDAVAEDIVTTAGTKHKKSIDSVDSNKPPSKRARTASGAADAMSENNGIVVPTIHKEDASEVTDTTEVDGESSASLEQPSVKKPKSDSFLPPVTPAGKVDPVGYKTNAPPVGRPVRIYADGVFDLFHVGHMRSLEQSKKAFPDVYLIVGVAGDTDTHARKGLTVLTGAERAESVRSCKWVDEVIPNCPWVLSIEFLEKHQIDFVAHDDEPYQADEGDDIYKPIKEKGMFLVTQRTEGVSTTGIITKIVRDYEKYISRQFKRGASRQELNVSWLKKNELDIKRHVIELRDSVRQNWQMAGHEVYGDIKGLWDRSRPASPAPFARTPSETDVNRILRSPTAMASLGFPGKAMGNDFAAGYSLGLVGGIRSWMKGNRTSLGIRQSQPGSPDRSSDDEDSDENKSPVSTKSRGRKDARPSNEDTTTT